MSFDPTIAGALERIRARGIVAEITAAYARIAAWNDPALLLHVVPLALALEKAVALEKAAASKNP